MKLDHEKTLAQELQHQRDLSGETLTEPSELPQPSPNDLRSNQEGQIAHTPNLNSCEPHRSYQYIRSIKPRRCVNVKSRFGHRNGCILCMFNVDHSGVSKPTQTHAVSPTTIKPQEPEEGPLEPEHTPQEPEVELSRKDKPDAEAPQELKSPDIENFAEQETPSVKNNAGDESSEKPPVIDSQSPVESPLPEYSAEDNTTKAQVEDATSEDSRAVGGEANKFEDAPAPELHLHKSPASTLHPTEDATADPANQTTSDDYKLIDDTSSTDEEVSSAEDDEKHIVPSEQKDVVTQEPPTDVPFQTEEQKDENDAEAGTKSADEANATSEECFVPEEEGTGLGHVFPFLNPNYEPDSLDNNHPSETCIEGQKDNMTPEPSTVPPVQTEEPKGENNVEANMKKADEGIAVPLESFIPEEEGTGLGHAFPFANPNHEPESLKNPHDAETYDMEQKDVVIPEPPADVPAKTKEPKDENSTSERNMSILAKVNKKNADDAEAVTLESVAPEEQGIGLGHVFPFLNPNYTPESLENLHEAEVAAKESGGTSKLNPATSSEINNEDSLNEVPDNETNEEDVQDSSNKETSTIGTAQEDKHSHQNAPIDGEKNDKAGEVIPSNDEKEQTAMEATQVEKQGADENDVTSEAQAPAEIEDFKDAPIESASNPDTESILGEANLEVEKELDSNSSMPDGDLDAPVIKAVPEGSALHHVLPFRTRSSMECATFVDTTPDHTSLREGNRQPAEEDETIEDGYAQHDEDDSKNTEEIKEAESMSPSDSPRPAKNPLASVEHDPEMEHTSSDWSEQKQDQQPLPSVKPKDTQHLTEELQGPSAIHPLGAVKKFSLGEPNKPDVANKDAASESSSDGSAYESFDDEDDTNGEDNLISQAVSNLRHETLNDRLMDRLVEDPVRVGEIVAASAQTKEEEELKGSEKLSSVLEDLALSDQDSTPKLKLAEPVPSTDKDETLKKPPPSVQGDNQKSTADDHSQQDMVHDRLASSLAEDRIGVSELISAKSGEVAELTVDVLAPSVQIVPNDGALATPISAALNETEDAILTKEDIQDQQQPAPAVVLEIEDEPKAKLTEITSPPQETEAPTELAVTTPMIPTPTKSQQRRAQAKRAKERKAAERAAAAGQNNEGATTVSSAADKSEKKESGKTNMTKRQIKRARQTRAKQRRMEAEKSSTQ